MKNKFNLLLINAFAVITSATGLIVMIGWILDIKILKSVMPYWTTMKFSTAMCFVFSGIILYFIINFKKYTETAPIFISVSSLIIFLFMGFILISFFIEKSFGVENLFVKETPGAVNTPVPGMPSLLTIVNFILIACSGFAVIMKVPAYKIILYTTGIVITMVGFITILGYIFNIPAFYYSFIGNNTAIAINTSVLFILLGTGLILFVKKEKISSGLDK